MDALPVVGPPSRRYTPMDDASFSRDDRPAVPPELEDAAGNQKAVRVGSSGDYSTGLPDRGEDFVGDPAFEGMSIRFARLDDQVVQSRLIDDPALLGSTKGLC